MYTVTEGSRAEVFHGTAKHTPGGLVKGDLIQDKYGSIKSKAAVAAAMVKVFKPAKKGDFKLVPKKGTKKYKTLIKKM